MLQKANVYQAFYKINLCAILEEVKGNEVKVAQSCPTLCDPMDYSVHGILRARILEWVDFPLLLPLSFSWVKTFEVGWLDSPGREGKLGREA